MMIIAASGSVAHAEHHAPVAEHTVKVCTEASPSVDNGRAQMIASEMFKGIGVKLEWHGSVHCPSGALRISLSTRTPSRLQPGALGYALPYEGTHIVVFLDRINASVSKNTKAALLGHVYAHEITHILEGECRHSATGLMRARWTGRDYAGIDSGPMPFAQEDIELIQMGFARREVILMAAVRAQ
jgi:hypothetical protein